MCISTNLTGVFFPHHTKTLVEIQTTQKNFCQHFPVWKECSIICLGLLCLARLLEASSSQLSELTQHGQSFCTRGCWLRPISWEERLLVLLHAHVPVAVLHHFWACLLAETCSPLINNLHWFEMCVKVSFPSSGKFYYFWNVGRNSIFCYLKVFSKF